MLLVNLFIEFKFDGFSTDTCRSLVAMKDVRILIVKSSCCLLLSNRQHQSCDDSQAKSKRENYQRCSVLLCVPQLCSHKHNRINISY